MLNEKAVVPVQSITVFLKQLDSIILVLLLVVTHWVTNILRPGDWLYSLRHLAFPVRFKTGTFRIWMRGRYRR